MFGFVFLFSNYDFLISLCALYLIVWKTLFFQANFKYIFMRILLKITSSDIFLKNFFFATYLLLKWDLLPRAFLSCFIYFCYNVSVYIILYFSLSKSESSAFLYFFNQISVLLLYCSKHNTVQANIKWATLSLEHFLSSVS